MCLSEPVCFVSVCAKGSSACCTHLFKRQTLRAEVKVETFSRYTVIQFNLTGPCYCAWIDTHTMMCPLVKQLSVSRRRLTFYCVSRLCEIVMWMNRLGGGGVITKMSLFKGIILFLSEIALVFRASVC